MKGSENVPTPQATQRSKNTNAMKGSENVPPPQTTRRSKNTNAMKGYSNVPPPQTTRRSKNINAMKGSENVPTPQATQRSKNTNAMKGYSNVPPPQTTRRSKNINAMKGSENVPPPQTIRRSKNINAMKGYENVPPPQTTRRSKNINAMKGYENVPPPQATRRSKNTNAMKGSENVPPPQTTRRSKNINAIKGYENVPPPQTIRRSKHIVTNMHMYHKLLAFIYAAFISALTSASPALCQDKDSYRHIREDIAHIIRKAWSYGIVSRSGRDSVLSLIESTALGENQLRLMRSEWEKRLLDSSPAMISDPVPAPPHSGSSKMLPARLYIPIYTPLGRNSSMTTEEAIQRSYQLVKRNAPGHIPSGAVSFGIGIPRLDKPEVNTGPMPTPDESVFLDKNFDSRTYTPSIPQPLYRPDNAHKRK